MPGADCGAQAAASSGPRGAAGHAVAAQFAAGSLNHPRPLSRTRRRGIHARFSFLAQTCSSCVGEPRGSLQETLVTLTERLRETVAQAVSNNLASAIREAVHALFTDSEPSHAPPSYYPSSPYRHPSTWGESDRYDRENDDDLQREDWSSNQSRGWRDVECETPEPTGSQETPQPRVRWNGALAVGCQVTAWWLRRQAGRASAASQLVALACWPRVSLSSLASV